MTTTFVPNDTEEGKMHLYSNAVGPKFHSSLERVHYIHKTQFIIWRPRYFSMQELSVGIWVADTSFKRSNYPIKIDDKTSLLLCDKTQKEACKLCWACRDFFYGQSSNETFLFRAFFSIFFMPCFSWKDFERWQDVKTTMEMDGKQKSSR